MRDKSAKFYDLGIYALMIFFVFYFVQALYYHYYFYDTDGLVDWPVYTQALQLINLHDLNPYLSIRGLRIFNDHFDPIIIPFALTFAKVFPPALVMVSVEIFFFIAAAWLIFWYAKKREFSPSATFLMIAYLLFNKGTVVGLLYPAHPTMWSTFALVCLGISWMEQRFKWILLSLIFLFTFKEEFPLVGFMMVISYAYKKQWRESFTVFIVSFAWFWFTQHRGLFFEGQMNDYSGTFWDIVKNPLSVFHVTVIKSIDRLTSLLTILILLALPFLYIKEGEWKKISWSLVFLSLPLLFIRSTYYRFMMQMTNHYFSQLTTLWGLSLFNAIKQKHFSLRFLFFYLSLLILSQGISFFGTESSLLALIKNWRVISYVNVAKDRFQNRENKEWERREELERWVDYFKTMGDNVNIFTTAPFDIHFTKNRYVYLSHWSWSGAKDIEDVLNAKDERKDENENYLVLSRKDVDLNNTFIKNFMTKGEIIVNNEYILVVKQAGRGKKQRIDK